MPTPSLLIVPARFKSGKMYSQIPTSGAGDFTVTRATTATRVNASGLIESVASGIPRLDYFASGGVVGCPALLVEPAATNFVPSGVGFNVQTGVQTSGVTDSPAISINGTLCTKNEASGNTRYVSQVFSNSALASGITYSVSRFFKYNGVAFNTTLEASSATQWGNTNWKQVVVLSAASGVTLGASTTCTGSVENFGNGWHRVCVRVTTGATIGGASTVNVLSELSSALLTGQGFLAACPQLETGSVATSYIPTTTAAVTRNAEVITVSGAVSGSIGQTEGTVYAEFQSDVASDEVFFVSRQSGAGSNRIAFTKDSANILKVQLVANNVGAVNFSGSVSGMLKMAFAYKTGSSALYVNGNFIASSTTTFTFSATGLTDVTINKSSILIGGSVLRPTMFRAIALYTTRLTNAQLASLTT